LANSIQKLISCLWQNFHKIHYHIGYESIEPVLMRQPHT
jgi:hypothetical protein